MITVAGGIAAWSVAMYRLSLVEKVISAMKANGTDFAREEQIRVNARVEHLEHKTDKLEINTEFIAKQVNEIDGNVRVIRSLLEQRSK
jgi:hypothetical protein